MSLTSIVFLGVPSSPHRRIVPSTLPVATVLLSGLKATEMTPSVCPFNSTNRPGFAVDQMRPVRSMQPVASHLQTYPGQDLGGSPATAHRSARCRQGLHQHVAFATKLHCGLFPSLFKK